jgi:hypothetical protein
VCRGDPNALVHGGGELQNIHEASGEQTERVYRSMQSRILFLELRLRERPALRCQCHMPSLPIGLKG